LGVPNGYITPNKPFYSSSYPGITGDTIQPYRVTPSAQVGILSSSTLPATFAPAVFDSYPCAKQGQPQSSALGR